MPRHEIVIKGVVYACDAPVYSWVESGLKFPLAPFRPETRVVMVHWTGAENGPATVVKNMTKRRVSVPFIVAANGAIYQTADAAARCIHGGVANDYAVGIEFINRGHALTLPDRGVVRERVVERVHGVPVRYGKMTEAQVAAGIALVGALCRHYRIPPRIPIDSATGDVHATVLPPTYLKRYTGILPHYAVERDKVDPAPDFLRRLAAALDPPGPPLVS